jgi:hypothetical protein
VLGYVCGRTREVIDRKIVADNGWRRHPQQESG